MFGIDDLLIGLAISGVAGAASGAAQGIGAANAASAQEKAAQDAMGVQQRMYDQQRQDMMPWLTSGRLSLADLMSQMQGGEFNRGFDPSQIANDPGYQFRMAQGQKALERSASARGMLNSGGALRSLSRYSQGLASDEYQNAWNRNQAENTGRFNRLASLAGVGQQAAQTLGSYGAQNAQQMGNLYGAVGNAQSAGAMGMANAFSGGMQTIGNAGQMYGMRGLLANNVQQPMPEPIPTQDGYGQSFAGSMGMNGRGFGLNYGGR